MQTRALTRPTCTRGSVDAYALPLALPLSFPLGLHRSLTTSRNLSDNPDLTTLPAGIFDSLVALEVL